MFPTSGKANLNTSGNFTVQSSSSAGGLVGGELNVQKEQLREMIEYCPEIRVYFQEAMNSTTLADFTDNSKNAMDVLHAISEVIFRSGAYSEVTRILTACAMRDYIASLLFHTVAATELAWVNLGMDTNTIFGSKMEEPVFHETRKAIMEQRCTPEILETFCNEIKSRTGDGNLDTSRNILRSYNNMLETSSLQRFYESVKRLKENCPRLYDILLEELRELRNTNQWLDF